MFRRSYAVCITMVCFAAGAAQAQTQTELCVPWFLNGSEGGLQWRSSLVLHNRDQVQAQAQLSMHDSSGVPLAGFTMRRRGGNGPDWQVGPNGQISADPLGPRSGVGYESTGEGPFQSGYLMIRSQDRLAAHARLQVYNDGGTLLGETVISPGQSFRQGFIFADREDGADIGLALTNPSSSRSSACTVTIIDSEGNEAESTQVTLAPATQTARYLFELFPNIARGEVISVRINCQEPVCALALRLHGLGMAQIPVFIED